MADISLPKTISPNGQEIWDWAARLSAERQRIAKIRELTIDIRNVGTVCGDCDLWMKSSYCPREVNVNGRRRGPSMNAAICGKFEECWSATERRKDLQDKLALIHDKCEDLP